MSKEAAGAIFDTLESPNEYDRNGEAANVVDGLFAIARAIERLADAVEKSAADETRADTPGGDEINF